MSDSPTALITVAEYKTITGMETSAAKVDEKQIEFFCNAATTRMETECRRKFIEPAAAITELFTGNDSQRYYVRQRRVSGNATPTLAYLSNGEWFPVAAPSYSFAIESEAGYIYFTDGNIFFRGGAPNNWRVTYKYGWTQALAPADLKLLCAILVQRAMLFQGRGKEGLAAEAQVDVNLSFNPALSDDDKRILRKYTWVSL